VNVKGVLPPVDGLDQRIAPPIQHLASGGAG
jgi:hypothetical protein